MPKKTAVADAWPSLALHRIIVSRFDDVKAACVAAGVSYQAVKEWVYRGRRPNVETLDQLLTGIGSGWEEWADAVREVRGEHVIPPALRKEIDEQRNLERRDGVDPAVEELRRRLDVLEAQVGDKASRAKASN